MRHKPKILILFTLCVLVILGLWFYSLKLNLSKPSDGKGKFDLNLGEIFSDIGDTFKNLPPPPKFSTSTPEATNQVIDTLAEKLKQLENTNTSTADWQIYSNKDYGFEIKYPKNWLSYVESNNIFIQPKKEALGDIAEHLDALVIKIEQSKGDLEEKIKSDNKSRGTLYQTTPMAINNLSGYKIITQCEGIGCGSPEWYFLKSGFVYHFSINLSEGEVYEQILSTFKFLK